MFHQFIPQSCKFVNLDYLHSQQLHQSAMEPSWFAQLLRFLNAHKHVIMRQLQVSLTAHTRKIWWHLGQSKSVKAYEKMKIFDANFMKTKRSVQSIEKHMNTWIKAYWAYNNSNISFRSEGSSLIVYWPRKMDFSLPRKIALKESSRLARKLAASTQQDNVCVVVSTSHALPVAQLALVMKAYPFAIRKL